MLLKSVDKNRAFELSREGNEVNVMVPGTEPGWENMKPMSLDKLLEGVVFLERVPATINPDLEEAIPATAISIPPDDGDNPSTPSPPTDADGVALSFRSTEKPRRKMVEVDTGKLLVLRKARWSLKRIAEEMKISESTVWNYLNKLEEQDEKD